MALDLSPAYSAFECGTLGLAYNEIAFRHFLDIERRRAQRARRTLLLLLVHFRTIRMSRAPLGPRISSQVFKALGGCVREVDFVGWHREGKVAGAVVALGGGASADVQRADRRSGGQSARRTPFERPGHAASGTRHPTVRRGQPLMHATPRSPAGGAQAPRSRFTTSQPATVQGCARARTQTRGSIRRIVRAGVDLAHLPTPARPCDGPRW